MIWAAAAMIRSTPEEVVRTGIEVPNAIEKQHNAYVLCQDEHFDPTKIQDRKSFAAEVEKAISECSEQKAALIQESEKILSSTMEYADPAKRQDAIAQSFDGYDQMRRAMAQSK